MQSKFITKIFCVLFSVILSVVTLCTGFVAQAKSTAALKDEKQKIQAQIDSTESKISSLKADKSKQKEYLSALKSKINLLKDELNNLQDQADSLQGDINTIQAQIDKVQAKIDKVESDIIETQKEIDEKQDAFDKTYNEYCERLRAMYVSGSTTTLEVLLTSTDMSSILTRAQMVKSVSQQDSKTLDQLMKQMEEINKDKEKLQDKKAELKTSRQSLVKDRSSLQSKKNELDKSISEYNAKEATLDSEVSECNSLIAKIDSQTKEYSEFIVKSQAEQDRIDAEINAAASAGSSHGSSGGNSHAATGTGQFGYPTSTRTISAYFGYGGYSSGGYHGGVDFPVSSGSNIFAADSGTVITAEFHYSWGNYIVIDHGHNLYSLYAHNSSLLVSAGQNVKKGQVIAKAGSTGNSTGPHCHFEVWSGGCGTGYRVNPLNYL